MKRLTILLVLLLAAPASASEQGAARYLRLHRHDAARRHAFLYAMPKGGDLHNHLSGAVYAESMVRQGAADGDCVDDLTLVSSHPPCKPGEEPLSDALSDDVLYDRILRAWSMKGFRDGMETGHDHFFATFDKFDAAQDGHTGDALAEATSRAAAQHEQYVETLITPRFGDVWALADQVRRTRDLPELRRRLLDAGLRSIVPRASADLDAALARERRDLGCGTAAARPACRLPVRFDVQVLRAMPPKVVFAQMVLGFELMAADPRWVGINLVQPEDDPVALRDYRLHMRMLGFLRGQYPKGHITLHAGELVPGLAPPADLRFHIRAAILRGRAERIGHGVDVRWERDPMRLLRLMARRQVLVEVPLTSNRQILGVSGRRHPIRLYRRSGVPIALATDDEGVSRTDLTEQYEQAVTQQGFGYRELKRIARDSLGHAFLSPEAKARALAAQRAAFARFEARFP